MLVLPPAPCGPYFQVKPGGASVLTSPSDICSTLTFDQSASSSSAMIIGKAVLTPCPISGLRAPITVRPSASMRMNRPSSRLASAADLPSAACKPVTGTTVVNTSAPPALSDTLRKPRRESRSGAELADSTRCVLAGPQSSRSRALMPWSPQRCPPPTNRRPGEWPCEFADRCHSGIDWSGRRYLRLSVRGCV